MPGKCSEGSMAAAAAADVATFEEVDVALSLVVDGMFRLAAVPPCSVDANGLTKKGES